jgi:hypothetical protein
MAMHAITNCLDWICFLVNARVHKMETGGAGLCVVRINARGWTFHNLHSHRGDQSPECKGILVHCYLLRYLEKVFVA